MSALSALALSITGGAMAGTRYRLAGAAIVVGRSPDCTYPIADPSLSRRHFELAPEGDVWRVRDLESRNGISVNGTIVREAVVRQGDEIRAGDITFRLVAAAGRLSEASEEVVPASNTTAGPPTVPLQLFPFTEPTLSAEAPPPADGTLAAVLLAHLRPPPSRLYALIDGAQAFEMAFAARLMGHELYTIFSGDLAGILAHVGPCLVVIGERSAFVQKWVEQVGSHAGVLFESAGEFDAVCAHLRNIFVATDEERQEYFFRFYDPRVLRAFLPTCHLDELREFFGPIGRWVAETEDAAVFTSLTIAESGLRKEEIRAVPEESDRVRVENLSAPKPR